MYAFDYLTLLLSGALDAQAVIANRLCGAVSADSHPSFRWNGYLAALRAKGATRLCDYIESSGYSRLSELLYMLRNTIHRASLAAFAKVTANGAEESHVAIPQEMQPVLLEAADHLGGVGAWGISTSRIRMLDPDTQMFVPILEANLEPWSFAAELTDQCLAAIDSIAAVTDFTAYVPGDQFGLAEASAPATDEDDARFLILF